MENHPAITHGPKTVIPDHALKQLEQNMLNQLNAPTENNILISKTANAWLDEAKEMPIPQMLFDQMWYEGELCVLFAASNAGKSLLAMQIANSICTGVPIRGFGLGALPQKVMYADFELNAKQFQNRYSENYQHNFNFSGNLIRTVIDSKCPLLDQAEFEEAMKESIIQEIIRHNIKVLIVDNLTWLTAEAEKSKEASGVMKFLKRIKEEMGLSILVLAHTPKRDESLPITANDCAGSKMLGNFSDSSFTIGASSLGINTRYIKQIKVRMGSLKYGTDNVITCNITKNDSFTEFVLHNYSSEQIHLKTNKQESESDLKNNIIELNKAGYSMRQTAEKLNVSHMKVKRVLDRCNAE